MSFIPFLQAAEGSAPSASAPGSMLVSFFPVILIIVVFYFLMIRPQSKKQKETERMLNVLNKVITIGGIHGVVSSVKENTVIVKVDDDCKIEFNRTAISTVELSDEEKAKLAQAQAAKKSKGFFKSKKSEEKIESEKTSDKD